MSVIGLGNALVDVLLKLESDATLQEIGIAKGAMEMIDREKMISIRQAQERLERSMAPGGSVCNSMRAISYLGGQAAFIGKIGDDTVGRFYEEALRKAGTKPFFQREGAYSGSCTVLISPDGERTMCTYLGPAAQIDPEKITDEMLSAYDYLYIEGYLIVNEPLVRHTMERAKRLGLKVALDLSNFNIVNAFKPLLSDLIPNYVDILFSNESEAEAFTGQPAQDAVRTLSQWVDVAIVTIGKEGQLIGSEDRFIAVPAEGGKPIDTTGAGDNFAAGFLYGQSIGATLEQSARIGSLLSGYVIGVVGPQIPDHAWETIHSQVKSILS
ncbi:MAG: adenosine kinase [Parabacteroides sp.]